MPARQPSKPPYAAGRTEFAPTKGTRERFQRRNAPRSHCREEFDMLEPEIQSAHDVSGSSDPGKKWYFRCNCGSTQFIGQARRYDEFGTCRHRSAELGSIRHCPRTDDRAVHFCHF